MFKKVIILAIIIVLYTNFSFAQTADEIIQKSINARGGSEKLKNLTSLKVDAQGSSMGMEYPILTFYTAPDKYRVEAKVFGTAMTKIFNGSNGWVVSTMGLGDLNGKKFETEKDFSTRELMFFLSDFIDYKTKGSSAEFLGKENVNEKEALKIKFIKSGETNEEIWYFDATSYLPVKCTNQSKSGYEINSELSDYQEVSGIKFPFTVNGFNMGKIKIKTLEVNPKLDLALFEKPEIKEPEQLPADPTLTTPNKTVDKYFACFKKNDFKGLKNLVTPNCYAAIDEQTKFMENSKNNKNLKFSSPVSDFDTKKSKYEIVENGNKATCIFKAQNKENYIYLDKKGEIWLVNVLAQKNAYPIKTEKKDLSKMPKLSGKINSKTWTFTGGKAEVKFEGEYWITLYGEKAEKCLNFMSEMNLKQAKIGIYGIKKVGEVIRQIDVKNSYGQKPSNDIISFVGGVITLITSDKIEGYIEMEKEDGKSIKCKVNGKFSVPICKE